MRNAALRAVPVRPNKNGTLGMHTQAIDKAMTVLRSRKRRSGRDAWLSFAGTPTEAAEAGAAAAFPFSLRGSARV